MVMRGPGFAPDGIPLEMVEVAYTRPEERRAGIAEYLAQQASAAAVSA